MDKGVGSQRLHTEGMVSRGKGRASLRREECGSPDSVSLGGEARPGWEGPVYHAMRFLLYSERLAEEARKVTA